MIIPIDLKPLKATMPTTTPTIWDRISEEKTKVSERLARLDTDRATVATQLTDLETAEGVLMRVSKTPPARRPASAAAAEAKAATATRGRGRPPKAATSKSAGREPNAPSLGERLLALATGKTRQELYVRAPTIARAISASQCSAISVPILPTYDPQASKAVIHCLKPRHPTVRLCRRNRWSIDRQRNILVDERSPLLWSEDHRMDLAAWPRGLGLEQYAPAFRDNDVDGEVLPQMTADDSIAIGVTSVGHRRKLLAAMHGLPPIDVWSD